MGEVARVVGGTSASSVTLVVERRRSDGSLSNTNVVPNPTSESFNTVDSNKVEKVLVRDRPTAPPTQKNEPRSDGSFSNTDPLPFPTSESDTTVDSTNVGEVKGTPPSTQENEPRCDTPSCLFRRKLLVHSEDIWSDITPSEDFLQKLTTTVKTELQIERERGSVDEISIKECNRSFIEKYYPNISKGVFSWPSIFPARKSSDSTFDKKTKLGKKENKHSDFEIRSETAERDTFQTLMAMLELRKMPSFIICGYKWKRNLPKELVNLLQNEKEVSKLFEYGESDILVLLPSIGVLAIEVKSHVRDSRNLNLEKCFNQCEKVVRFVACSTLDIAKNKRIGYVKIGSLPNIFRKDVESRMICSNCSSHQGQHFITKDELESEQTLSEWFDKILELLGSHCDFDLEVYKGMIGRFLGPLSRVRVEPILGVINDTHSQLESLRSKFTWVGPSTQETETLFKTPSFLWINGYPGSLKTNIVTWKVNEISESVKTGKHVIHLISRDKMLKEYLETLFRSGLGKNIFLNWTEPLENSKYENFDFLLNVMTKFKSHPESHVSFITDDIQLFNNDNPVQLSKEWEVDTLQNVWIIQTSAYKMTPETPKLVPPKLETVRLKKVERQSNAYFLIEYVEKQPPMKHKISKPFKIEVRRPHKTKFIEFTETQYKIASGNPSFLWITGEHGSGKTILALWKVQTLLKSAEQGDKENVIYFIAGNKDFMFIEHIKSLFQSVERRTKVQLQIESFDSVFGSNCYDLKYILDVMEMLTSRHPESDVSIIIDEFWLVNDSSPQQRYTNWKRENLKNVWIIQNPACKDLLVQSSLEQLGFEKVHLETTMRLSESNLKFLNNWLGTGLKVLHGFKGLRPIMLKMECICEKLQEVHEGNCTPFLITKLAEKVLHDLGEVWDDNDEFVTSEDVAIITQTHFEVKNLLAQKHSEIPVRASLFFTGCEKKVVIVDIRRVGDSGDYKSILCEALTRTTGLLVLFDVSCKTRSRHRQEETITNLVDRLYKLSQIYVKRKGSVHLSDPEIKALQREIDLRWYRDEKHIQANVGSAVTMRMLRETISQTVTPLKEDMKTVKETISQTVTPLKEDMKTVKDDVSKMGGDISEMGRDLFDVKQILQNERRVWACHLI